MKFDIQLFVTEGTSKNDSLTNKSDNDSVYGYAGNDKIINYGDSAYIDGGAGNDIISLVGGEGVSTILGGTGTDTVYFNNKASRIYQYTSGDGNDIINGFSDSDTIIILGSTYSSTSSGKNIILNVGKGKITLTGAATLSNLNIQGTFSETISGGGVNVLNNLSNVLISGTDKVDSIWNNAGVNYVTINAYAGNDTIESWGSYNYIDAGSDDDYIFHFPANSTIHAGTGNDTVSLYSASSAGDVITYTNGDGNDLIQGFSAEDTLIISGSTYDSTKSNNDIILAVDSDFITLQGAANFSKLNIKGTLSGGTKGTKGNDSLKNTFSNVTIDALAGNDTIDNFGASVKIYAGAGNDSIYNNGKNSSIFADAGNDTIYNHNGGDYSFIDGGAGSDSIFIPDGDYITVNGGADNDTIVGTFWSSSIAGGDGADVISLSGGGSNSNTINAEAGDDEVFLSNPVNYQYATGDGNDAIYGFGTSTLNILSGSISNVTTSGTDVVLKVGKGSLTLKNKVGETIYYKVGDGDLQSTVVNLSNPYSVVGSNNDDFISYTLKGATIDALGGDDTIKNSGASVEVYGGAGSDSIYNISANRATLSGGDGNDTIFNIYSGGGDAVSMVGGKGNDYIYDSFSRYSTLDGGSDDDTLTAYRGYSNLINAGAGNDLISLDTNYSTMTVIGGTGDDTIFGDSVNNNGVLYLYNSGDGNDVIFNVKANDTVSIGGVSSYTAAVNGESTVLSVGKGSISLSGVMPVIYPETSAVITNTSTLTTISGTSFDDTINNSANFSTILGGDGNDKISNTYSLGGGDDVLIDGGAGNDSIYNNYGYRLTIDGGADDDTITVYRGVNNSINGGAGNDKISLSSTNGTMTVTGGAGNDTIYGDTVNSYGVLYRYKLGDGNDIIYNVKANDTVSIDGVNNYTTKTSGKNTVLSAGSGANAISVTLAGTMPIIDPPNIIKNTVTGATVNDTAGVDNILNVGTSAKIYGNGGKDTIINSANYALIDGGEGNDKISNIYSTGGDYVTISGGAGNDSIYNDYGWNVQIDGGADNDSITVYRGAGNSINGGAGEDRISLNANEGTMTVSGGTDNDTIFGDTVNSYGVLYQYTKGDGNDIIYNVKANDTIQIAESEFTTATSGSNVVVTVGKSAITLVGAKNNVPKFIYAGQYIENSVSNSLISGSISDDTIKNNSSAVGATINGGTGNDSLSNYAGSVSIVDGEGNDTINNYYSSDGNVTVNGGAGDDSINNNYGHQAKIFGGAGADNIFNSYGDYDTIDGGADNDTITVYHGANNSINGAEGNDLISVNSSEGTMTVTGGKGNDTIYGDSVSSYGIVYEYNIGDGNDVIYGYKSTDSLSINGNYTASTVKNNVIVSAGSGAITVVGGKGKLKLPSTLTLNTVSSAKVNGKTTNDNIWNTATSAKIYGNAGNDSIKNSAQKATLSGGDGKDTIYNVYDSTEPAYVSISGGADNDVIINSLGGGHSTIDGGEGNDTITEYGTYQNSINGGAGNDKISLNAIQGSMTVTGGAGNDTIYGDTVNSYGVLYQYNLGDGNDIIYNVKANDTVSIGGVSSYTTTKSGKNIVLKVGSGKQIGAITLSGAMPIIYPAEQTGTFVNTVSGASIAGTSEGDTITNNANYVSISAGAGDDTIYNNSSYYVTMVGGAGSDTITDSKGNVGYINGGAGNDVISLKSSAGVMEVSGGKGDDTIYGDSLKGALYHYQIGDGNDVITGVNANDSLSISGGKFKKSTVGNDIVVSVEGGNVTLAGAKSKAVKIYGNSADDSVTAQDVIKTFMSVLDTVKASGTAALDEAVNVASNGKFQNVQAAINQMVADCQSAASATKFLKDKCGIDLSNTDTGAITGSDAGGSTAKTAASIVAEKGNFDKTFTGNSFKVNGLTIKLASFEDGKATAINFSSLTNEEKYIWRALKTWWAESALNLIAKSYGDNYKFSNATYYFGFVDNENYQAATGKNCIAINIDKYKNIDTSSSDGKISGELYLDRVIAREFTQAVMMNTIDGYGDLPEFITDGTAALTHGIDDDKKSDINYLAGNATALKNALSTGEVNADAGGYIFLRYLAKQGAGNSSSSEVVEMANEHGKGSSSIAASKGISIKGAVMTVAKDYEEDRLSLMEYVTTVTKVDATKLTRGIAIIGNEQANSIKAGTGTDTISGNNGNDTLYGGSGNDYVIGDLGNDKLFGEDGNDTISGGSGTDTLTGGKGNDIFVHTVDYDYIADYEVGKDKIKLSGSRITGASVKGSDVILNTAGTKFITEGAITIKGGKGKKITVIDSEGNETTRIYPTGELSGSDKGISVKGVILTATSDFEGGEIDLADYASTVTKVNAAAIKKSAVITGNAAANSIKGGTDADTISGDAGNDTLSAGAGNDLIFGGAGNDVLLGENGDDTLNGNDGNNTLTGGAGNDVFIISGGKDLITDYKAGQDKIKIENGAITKVKVSDKNVVFTAGKSSFTVQGGKGQKITVIDSYDSTTTKVWSDWSAEDTLPAGLTYDKAKEKITAANNFGGSEIDLADYVSTVTTVDASALTKAININGNGNANSIIGGSGNDTLDGGVDNDTLTGGEGSDTFIYAAGNDVITDYTSDDTIKISDKITKTTFSGNDVTFAIGSGLLTVKNGKNSNITITDAANKTATKMYADDLPAGLTYDKNFNTLTVDKTYSGGTIDLAEYASTVTTVNASKLTNSIEITGNGNANSIAGGSKSDTLSGGAGNDTLTGGKGNDVFVYSAGKDVITDYKAGEDTIKIESGEITQSKISGKDIVLTIGSGTLTVKDGKDKKITVTDSANNTTTKTYTNATYTGSISEMLANEDMWFIDGDSEFISDNTNIDSVSEITANNYSVGSITSALNDSLVADSYEYQAAYATDSNKIK
ncbi:MAG: hypothetical protein IKZ58_08975 [Selenomonadaceae bacterium]|nr:hypothetical protein [Selenomonadaceae bacterium]